jgi:hypothetical protein
VSSALPRDLDQARLRPHLRDRASLVGQQAAVLKREFERATAEGVDTTTPKWKVPVGDDLERLRGLPAIARDVRSAMKGTDLVGALLAKERRR